MIDTVSPKEFKARDIKAFHFSSYEYSPETATLYLRYQLDALSFSENFTFPGARPVPEDQTELFNSACRLLHIVAGISYYKAAIPPEIIFDTYDISQAEARFYTMLYKQGLGEYSFRNSVSIDHIEFPFSHTAPNKTAGAKLSSGIVVPVGGGKDSIVTIELLRKAKTPFSCFVLGTFPLINRVVKEAGHPLINVSRKLSPQLFAINQLGALNGHVPISAIIAASLTVSSILYGFDTAILSNERSADAGNLVVGGVSINHQFSKSYEFEFAFQQHLQSTLGIPFRYFSLLRPLSEIAIAKRFAASKEYDTLFSSCNSQFKISTTVEGTPLWCGTCPKCLSTFLCLAPFVERDRMISIFGKDLLDDADNIPTFAELCGVRGHKPFECVLDYDEAKAVFAEISNSSDWKDTVVVRWFVEQHLDITCSLRECLPPSGAHSIPDDFRALVYEAA